MSASSPRRLLLLLFVVGLAFPSHASATSWDLTNFLDKARGFFSALWTPVGCVIDASGPTQGGNGGKPVFAETGCVILPDGRCGA